MCSYAEKAKLREIEVIEAPIQAKAPYTDPKYEGIAVKSHCTYLLYIVARTVVNCGTADIPVHYTHQGLHCSMLIFL